LDAEQRLAGHWVANAEALPTYVKGGPLRKLLYAWVQREDSQIVHAGAVGRAGGGVLLVGASGSGKSTTSLACLESDLKFLADDACLVEFEPEPHVYGLYSTGKMTNDSLGRFPNLVPFITNPHRGADEKAIVFLNRCLPEHLIDGFPLRALLIPRITGRAETTYERTTTRQGMQSLAPSSIFQSATDMAGAFKALAGLVRQLPCYHLNVGTDLRQIPPVIEQVLVERGQ
jgi:hypothetical protein